MAKKTLSVTLEPSTIENLHRLAAEDYRNVSNMIDYIVAQYVMQQEGSSFEKTARAATFAKQMKIPPYSETQKKLQKNVHIDGDDRAYLERSRTEAK